MVTLINKEFNRYEVCIADPAHNVMFGDSTGLVPTTSHLPRIGVQIVSRDSVMVLMLMLMLVSLRILWGFGD